MKAIAVSQIIMIVLGVIVLGVIGYLLYANFLSGRGQMDYEKCRSMIVSQCGTCQITGKFNDCTIYFDSDKDATTCATLFGKTASGKQITNFDCSTVIK
jgi:hypothetical protein